MRELWNFMDAERDESTEEGEVVTGKKEDCFYHHV